MTRKRRLKKRKKTTSTLKKEFKKLAALSGWTEESSSSNYSSSETEPEPNSNRVSSPVRQNDDHNWLFRDFDYQQNQAATNEPVQACDNPAVSGRQRDSLSELRTASAEDYVTFPMNRGGSTSANVRLVNRIEMEDLPATSLTYSIQIQQSQPEILQFSYFNARLYHLLLAIFNDLVEHFAHWPNASVQFSLRHRLASEAFTSELRPLTVENGPYAVVEVLEQIHAWTQSEGKEAFVDMLDFECFVLDNSLHGEGVPLIGLDDQNFRKKSLSKANPNGSIIYVKNDKHCFYVAIYYGILYLELQAQQALRLNKSDTSQNHKKHLDERNTAFYGIIESTDVEQIYTETRDFFIRHSIDIDNYCEDDIFLKVIHDKFFIQTSIFEPVQGFKRKILVPARYNEKCPQLYLMRYKIPDKNHTTIRTTKSLYHYHALRHTKTLGGLGLYFCPYCGKLLS